MRYENPARGYSHPNTIFPSQPNNCGFSTTIVFISACNRALTIAANEWTPHRHSFCPTRKTARWVRDRTNEHAGRSAPLVTLAPSISLAGWTMSGSASAIFSPVRRSPLFRSDACVAHSVFFIDLPAHRRASAPRPDTAGSRFANKPRL